MSERSKAKSKKNYQRMRPLKPATIVQKVRNLKDKAFSVNVICGGDPFRMRTVAYKIVVTPLRICTENKKIVINQKVPHINI